MTVTLVAAVARNRVIGADGAIPWRLPGELRLVKELTIGHVLVMGRRTYDSIGRPLPDRTTVVVTRQPDWSPQGGLPASVQVAGSVSEALTLAQKLDDEVFVFGGEQVYADALPHADRLRISWVDAAPSGDAFFPEVDWSHWRETEREQHQGWALATYERIDSE